MTLPPTKTILALDYGSKRVGVASASTIARLAKPHSVINNDPHLIQKIIELAKNESAVAVVVGLPRGMQGQETNQTKTTRLFYKKLQKAIKLPVYLQDETLTSHKAETLLGRQLGYNKGLIDAEAAAVILEDFTREHPDLIIE